LKESCDVVVVGSGLAGFAAAIQAAELNSKVVLLEKTERVGAGNTFVSNGFYVGAGTIPQKEAGIEDSPERFLQDLTKILPEADPKQLRAFALYAAEGIEWLLKIGIDFHPVLSDPEVERSSFGRINSRVHIMKEGTYFGRRTGNIEGGEYFLAKLEEAFRRAGGITMANTSAKKLITNSKREIAGLEAVKTSGGMIAFDARAVVLACGGFQGNTQMLLKHVSNYADKAVCRSGRDMDRGYCPNTGDGHIMAQQVGAKLVNMSYVYAHTLMPPVSPYPNHDYCKFAIVVNKEGKRFVDESRGDVIISNALLHEADATGFIIVDSRLYDEFASLSVDLAVSYGAPKPVSAESFEELAGKIGVDPAGFDRAMREFDEAVSKGTTDQLKPPKSGRERPEWPRNQDLIRAIESPPYYGIPIVPGVTFTAGGIFIDDQSRVLDQNLEPIPGLYAAGELTGGLFTDYYTSGGGLTRCLVQGLVAGGSAAKYAKIKH